MPRGSASPVGSHCQSVTTSAPQAFQYNCVHWNSTMLRFIHVATPEWIVVSVLNFLHEHLIVFYPLRMASFLPKLIILGFLMTKLVKPKLLKHCGSAALFHFVKCRGSHRRTFDSGFWTFSPPSFSIISQHHQTNIHSLDGRGRASTAVRSQAEPGTEGLRPSSSLANRAVKK